MMSFSTANPYASWVGGSAAAAAGGDDEDLADGGDNSIMVGFVGRCVRRGLFVLMVVRADISIFERFFGELQFFLRFSLQISYETYYFFFYIRFFSPGSFPSPKQNVNVDYFFLCPVLSRT